MVVFTYLSLNQENFLIYDSLVIPLLKMQEITAKEPKPPAISASDKRTIQACLELREKVSHGVNLLKNFLHDGSSKLSVSMCSFMAKKTLSLSR